MTEIILYSTPAYIIGKHTWRIIVKPYGLGGSNCTSYQFRTSPNSGWQSKRHWPRYNINDGMTLGLPKTIAKIFYNHEKEIQRALNGQTTEHDRKHLETLDLARRLSTAPIKAKVNQTFDMDGLPLFDDTRHQIDMF